MGIFNFKKFNENSLSKWNNENSIYKDEIPNYADLLTIDEFMEMVEDGSIIEDDGGGYFSNGDRMNRSLDAFESDVPDDATHVAWFNK